MSRDFNRETKEDFHRLTDLAFSELKSGEEAVFSLHAEDSFFLRLNANRVRQNTHVRQKTLGLKLQRSGRSLTMSWNLAGSFAVDQKTLLESLSRARKEIEALPEDPHQVPLTNNGSSEAEFRGQIPGPAEAIDEVTTAAEGSDLAGLYCAGPLLTANRNSAGQNHWFATENFFVDYSLYNGEKAAKSAYAGSTWSSDEWRKNLARTRNQLSLLNQKTVGIRPGHYRTYLAPGAVAEILGLMSWGGLSASAWKRGQSPLRKLADGEVRLSEKFTLRENFDLGLHPAFNDLGEVSATLLPVIKNGRFAHLLTSSRSAKEFGLTANGASSSEGMRSPEILPGSLEEKEILRQIGTGLYLSSLHYLNWSDPNSARLTGMTRYACFWVEGGEIVGPIKDLRFDESLYEAFGSKLVDLTKDAEIDPMVMTYESRHFGGKKTPGALINDFSFTL